MENALVLAGIDTTGLTEQQKAELTQFYEHEMQVSLGGVDLRPQRILISKEACAYVTPLGGSLDEIRGVVVYKQKIRAFYEKGNKIPLCGSMDCVQGKERDTGEMRLCSNCPNNEWGTAVDDSGRAGRGKACKEQRRVFIMAPGAIVPLVISFPPTSLAAFDDYFSARLAAGVVDVAAETVFRLIPNKLDNNYTVAVGQFKLGAKVPAQDMLRLAKVRTQIKAIADSMEVSAEDYEAADQSVETVDPFAVDQQPA